VKRDLAALEDRRFDLAIVGAGVVGAAIARDAARRGLGVALIDGQDFAAATSEAMSHMVHGGIRYLAQGEFGQVRLSLAERAVWRRIAPHQVSLLPCMVPLAGGFSHNFALRAGVMLFNALGGRNVLAPGERVRLALDRAGALAAEPAIEQPALKGALVYHDCRVDEPERVVLGLAKSAWHAGAVVANHVACDGLVLRGGKVEGIAAIDRIGGGRLTIRTACVVNATGAWTGIVAGKLLSGQKQAALTLSKGIHLVVPQFVRRHALTLAGKGEHGFVLPWRGMNLVGTTDELISGDPSDASVEAADAEQLVAKIARLLPASRQALQSVAATYAGVRALPGSGADTYAMSRDGACADHRTDGAAGFFSVFGGKWTTARVMAEAAVDRIAEALGKPLRPCDTATAALEDAPHEPVPVFEQGWRERLPEWPEAEIADWVAAYGRSLPAVLQHLPDRGKPDPAALEAARFAHAADAEMAVTPQDLARRLARWYGVRHPGVAERASQWLAGKRKVTDARA
jgi:glycerol-3-phosphate dehydrogenase